MVSAKTFLSAAVSGIFLMMSMSSGLAAERHKDKKDKKPFPQAAIINKLHFKLVCGKRDPGARFVTSKDGKEVCDRTTGEIWEQNPMSNAGRERMNQAAAIAFCETLDKEHGQRYQLPTMAQLLSVLDYGEFDSALTPDIFSNVLPEFYWSASPFAGPAVENGWEVTFFNGQVRFRSQNFPNFVWCVRRDKDAHADW